MLLLLPHERPLLIELSSRASRGGKSHEFVVEFSGMSTGEDGQPYHRVLVDPDQAARLADAATLLEMLEDGEGFLLGEFAAVQRGALALGETLLAGAAGEDSALLVGPIPEADSRLSRPRWPWSGQSGFWQQKVFRSSMRLPPGPRHEEKLTSHRNQRRKSLHARQACSDTTTERGAGITRRGSDWRQDRRRSRTARRK
jgi:hypothetical protein